MVFEDILELLEDGDAEICESFKAWCDYYDGDMRKNSQLTIQLDFGDN